MNRVAILRILPLLAGTSVALVTGISVLTNKFTFYYGFPFGWRLAYCPILQPYSCAPYNWLGLFLDALLYMVLGYLLQAILSPLVKRQWGKPRP